MSDRLGCGEAVGLSFAGGVQRSGDQARRCRESVVRSVAGVCKPCPCSDVRGDACSLGSSRFHCSLHLRCAVKTAVGGNSLDLLWSCSASWTRIVAKRIVGGRCGGENAGTSEDFLMPLGPASGAMLLLFWAWRVWCG